MKLYIKQSVFTLGEQFTVKNEFEEDVYYVEGSFLKIPKGFTIYNRYHEEVAKIERQLFRLMGHYDIQSNKEEIVLKRNFTFFRHSYELLHTQWSLQGDFLSHNYDVVDHGRPIMRLRKHWFTWGDSYELDIPHDEDAVLALCIAICVDYEILKDQQNTAN